MNHEPMPAQGPWQAEEATVRGITQEWFVRRVDGDDIAIASDIRDRNGNYSEANARLIAAAPELLAAAVKVNALSIQTNAHKELRDAIAKAIGRVAAGDAVPECTCAAKDMTFGRCCKTMTPTAALTGGEAVPVESTVMQQTEKADD